MVVSTLIAVWARRSDLVAIEISRDICCNALCATRPAFVKQNRIIRKFYIILFFFEFREINGIPRNTKVLNKFIVV
jgi:hypothetical protein